MYRVFLFAAAMLLPLPAGLAGAFAAGGLLEQCNREAAACLEKGGDRTSCQAVVDECMSRNACEEVYMSCLELMELDEGVTESDCRKKRAQCREKRKR